VRRALLLTALLALTAPTAADAATRYDVRGGGWGHGVGMSQYGAYGMAQQGRSYREILSHYYRDTGMSEAAGRQVRVLLQWRDPYVRVRGATRLSAADGETRRLRPSTIYVVRPSTSGVLSVGASGGDAVGDFGAPVRFSRPGQPIRLLGRAINGVRSGLYRGTLELHPGGGVTAVNVLPLDPYVQGVVPGEMPSGWNIEALKAQAVAARSYALATRKSSGAFDQYPDTRSQVYRGVTGETPSTNGAVQATLGQILTHAGQPATTYFFSSSGGHTENVENVFKRSPPRPYLRGVPDPFDRISPRHRWTARFTPAQLDRRFGGYSPGRFRRIDVLKRGVSPRIVQARVEGSRGARLIDGPAIRSRLGLYDSWAVFRRISTEQAGRAPRLLRMLGFQLRRRIAGAFEPAPRRRRLLLERRSGRRWKVVRRLRTTRRGGYSVMVRRPGVYRVRSRSVAGPAVRVR
jgi:stage II sporulation protein D